MIGRPEIGDFMPENLRPYAGRITDADSHESILSQFWVEEFGQETKPLVEWLEGRQFDSSAKVDAESTEINADTVWKVEGQKADWAWRLWKKCFVRNGELLMPQ